MILSSLTLGIRFLLFEKTKTPSLTPLIFKSTHSFIIHSFIHSYFKQIFIDHLLCARNCSRCLGSTDEQNNRKLLLSWSLWSKRRKTYLKQYAYVISFLGCHTTAGAYTTTHCPTVLEARSLPSRCQQDWLLLRTMREECVPTSLSVS